MRHLQGGHPQPCMCCAIKPSIPSDKESHAKCPLCRADSPFMRLQQQQGCNNHTCTIGSSGRDGCWVRVSSAAVCCSAILHLQAHTQCPSLRRAFILVETYSALSGKKIRAPEEGCACHMLC